ncbi:uncharacterized protein LOC111023458 [Momordica charantia]|uniref:Uncharacterized protein LOC111023458 n=1 Tax=Momordica charantia TaxID=3673 RepID=A0A6J1DSD1_MOMCH|nr:uncharacterized protein LOC111023458 [Momordica charantia]
MFGRQGMGGGNIIRTASRAVARASGGLQDAAATATATRPSSPTSTSRATHRHGGSANFHGLASTSASSQSHCPVSATCGVAAGWPFCNRYCDEFVWISEERENGGRVCSEDGVGCWSVPSVDEVHGAVSALHQVFGEEKDDSGRVGKYMGLANRVSSVGSGSDWVEPCLELQMGGRGVERVFDAFHLLQTDPSVQRMVMSVSSDKAVWDAILNNQAVQHLKNSFYEAKDDSPQSSEESSPDKPPDESTSVIQWMFDNTKTRVMEVIERITELVNHLFENVNDDYEDEKKRGAEAMDPFEEKLRTSFFISIVVLLLVMVSRAHKASQ